MSQFYTIEPGGDTRNFSRVMESSDISEDLINLITCARIEKVVVDVKGSTWDIYMQAKGCGDRPLVKRVVLPIKGLKECTLHISRDPRELPLSEALDTEWEKILHRVRAQQPMINGWLSMTRCHVGDKGELLVEVADDLSLGFLRERSCDELLEDAVREVLGKNVKVSLIVGDFGDELQEIITEEEMREREEVVATLESNVAGRVSHGSGPLIGRAIDVDPERITRMEDIIEEDRNVVIEGMIFDRDIRALKSGRSLVTISVTDFSDSLELKIWEDGNDSKVSQACNPGVWIRAKGNVQTDRYSQELTMLPSDLQIVAQAERRDTAPEKRIELHLHTKMSAMDAVVDVEAAVARAAKWGHPAIAITDHGVVQSHPAAFDAGQKFGIKIIYGMEGYLVDTPDSDKSYHIVILAKDDIGLRNLYKLVSISHLDNFHRHPRIPRDDLIELREGLIIGSACEAGEVFQALLSGICGGELAKVANFYDYLEIQPTGNNEFMIRSGQVESIQALQELNRVIYDLGKELDKPVVATGDVHFLEPQDEIFRRILMAGQGYDDADKQPPLYLHTTDEMLEEFSYLGQEGAKEVVVSGPRQIADMIKDLRPVPDKLYSPHIEGADDKIRQMAYARARELYGSPLPEIVQARLTKELNAIIENGFSVIYLIAQKLVTKSLEDDYLVGSRGSVGSSFAATMCDITEVNPLPPHYRCGACAFSEFITDGTVGSGFDLPDKKCPNCGQVLVKDGQDIPFEVFLGFKGDKVPDIDLNFSGEYQDRIHKYTEELFGKNHVFRAATLSTLMDKTAYGFVRKYFEERSRHVRNVEINRLVKGCCGVKRTTGQHPGGLMIIPQDKDVHEFTPLQYPANDKNSGVITTHFEYNSFKERLLKLDLLGHTDPTQLRMLQDITGVDAKGIPLDDNETMKIFSSLEPLGISQEYAGGKVGTLAIPEFGTPFVRQMLEATLPTTFAELVRISGLSHGTDVWLNNAADLIADGTATLMDVIAVRDDIMNYLISCGVEPAKAFKIMENVRKGRGLKPDEEEAMKAAGVPDWYCESAKRIKYLFPKAHAAAYVTMSFRMAYFKVNYPAAFYASYFTVKASELDVKTATSGKENIKAQVEALRAKGNECTPKEAGILEAMEVALEAVARGITFLPVELEKSHAFKFQVVGNALLPPLSVLPSLGASAARNIVAAREERFFTSVEDLKTRAKLGKGVIEILREHDVLKELPESDQLTLF
jgi:DNA polymerase-3 subunit alpha (Gram-positive type)